MPLTFDTTETITPTSQRLSARFTPCGEYLVAGGLEGLLHRWSLTGDERKELSVIKGHHGWVEAIGFHPTELPKNKVGYTKKHYEFDIYALL